jgi:hypothetical protein
MSVTSQVTVDVSLVQEQPVHVCDSLGGASLIRYCMRPSGHRTFPVATAQIWKFAALLLTGTHACEPLQPAPAAGNAHASPVSYVGGGLDLGLEVPLHVPGWGEAVTALPMK